MAIITTVSMTQEEKDFINDYNLSPSQLIKEKIWEMQGMIRKITGDKIEKLTFLIEKQARRIEELEKDVLEKAETTTGDD